MEFGYDDQIINWISITDKNSRLDLIKKIILCTPYEELNTVIRFVDNAKKRKSPNKHLSSKRKKYQLKSQQLSEKTAPTSTSVAQTPVNPPSSWWEEVGKGNIISLDCEMVSLNSKNDFGKFINQAATVGIVDWDGNTVLDV